MQKNSVNILSCLKLPSSPQFQRKDLDVHIEAAMRDHLNLACAKLDETTVELNETRLKWHDTEAELNETRVSFLNYKLEKKKMNIYKEESTTTVYLEA